MNITRTHISCGIDQLSDLDIPTVTLKVVTRFYQWEIDAHSKSMRSQIGRGGSPTPTFIIFSDVNGSMFNGPQLAAYITKHKLGDITKSPYAVNHNTGNNIRIWVWRVNWKALFKWAENVS